MFKLSGGINAAFAKISCRLAGHAIATVILSKSKCGCNILL